MMWGCTAMGKRRMPTTGSKRVNAAEANYLRVPDVPPKAARQWIDDDITKGWPLPFLTMFSYSLGAYNWWVLFGSRTVDYEWFNQTRRCYTGLTLTFAVALCSIITGAALKIHAKNMKGMREVAWSFGMSCILFSFTTAILVPLLKSGDLSGLIGVTKVVMGLAQATIAGWFLKVFWDRATEILVGDITAQVDRWQPRKVKQRYVRRRSNIIKRHPKLAIIKNTSSRSASQRDQQKAHSKTRLQRMAEALRKALKRCSGQRPGSEVG
jgi:hypothetical protein